MAERFQKEDLIRALKRQILAQCDEKVALWIAKRAKCLELKPGTVIIRQDDDSCELYFILEGSMDVIVNGQRVNVRQAGQHVGEMAIVMNSRRTATVVTKDDCVVAKLTREQFLALATAFPSVWRYLAEELAVRLHQRRNLIREPNARPFVFIGSSGEQRDVAEQIRAALSSLDAEIQVWCDPGAFPVSETFIETLTAAAKRADFAILIFGRDDILISRRQRHYAPRDNVVFEAGLFIGGIGRSRTFLVRPQNVRVKILSDLAGVTLLDYKKAKGRIDVALACTQITATVRRLSVR